MMPAIDHRQPRQTGPRTVCLSRPTSASTDSHALLEETRQIMERTIEFVPHPYHETGEATSLIRRLRPASIDRPVCLETAKEGHAFVPALVESPLLSPEEERYWFLWMNFLKWRAEQNRRRLDLARPSRKRVNAIQADLAEALSVRNRIVRGNLRLVIAVAKKLASSLPQMSELISEGMLPLIRAAELFDIRLENRFSTYATWAIRNQMLRYLKQQQHAREQILDQSSCALESLCDRRALRETPIVNPQATEKTVERLLSTLPPRVQSILRARFGLEGHPQGQSFAEIADQIGLSKERVRQIVVNSLSKLRDEFSADSLRDES